MAVLVLLFVQLFSLSIATETKPACTIRITSSGLDLIRQEGLNFVAEELENITIPELSGKEGNFHYNIRDVRIVDLNLSSAALLFHPNTGLCFQVHNSSISITFHRKLFYWLFHDVGQVNASADGVSFETVLMLGRNAAGRLKITNMTCTAAISSLTAQFSGTLKSVYQIMSVFLTMGIRFLLNKQICPVLSHAALVSLNTMMDTVPVRTPVDKYVGIDYSLLSDPKVMSDRLDMDFRGMFYPLENENETLAYRGVVPVVKEMNRMLHMAVSEYFFDSAMFAYYTANVLRIQIPESQMSLDFAYLLRTTFFGAIVFQAPVTSPTKAPLLLELSVTAPPHCTIKPSGVMVSVSALMNVLLVPSNSPTVTLATIIMEAKLSAQVTMKSKSLSIKLDLKRFKMFSPKSTLESLALIPLQTPVKAFLKVSILPIVNKRTMRGVQIPLPEGIDLIKEVMENHMGFLTIGADLHFYKGLREVIEMNKQVQRNGSTTA
ncbi:phospholipid transfer protein isoform X2 [Callorhinchus milii]|nr:phospholipid transfer protein isoform X2 [Callorhinchus milii]XP_042197637.1 phospholipid transfer protein isoform X2 [Callorhinchus milii]XP_042197638.1 phospholipid transfer protein isoform X2 [Callorhinchus milii]